MLLKNILRIMKSYRFSLVKIILFEIIYLFSGYKGNRFNFTKNNIMTNNIPCPYYFLYRINRVLKKKNFNTFLDLGCGSGRAIDFFNKNSFNKKFIGIEYFFNQFSYCKKILKKHKNINIINADFIKTDFFHHDADCYFFNHPVADDLLFVDIIKKIIDFEKRKKNLLLIFVNCKEDTLYPFKNTQCIASYYVGDRKGYSVYCLNESLK